MADSSLFSLVGTDAGARLMAWCGGRSLTHNLAAERARHDDKRLVLDVGALDGRDAIEFATASQQHVFSFEPSPTKHEPIRTRLAQHNLTSNVTLLPFALSNRSGEAAFEMWKAPKAVGRAFVHNDFGSSADFLNQDVRPEEAPPMKDAHVVTVPVRTLDDVVTQYAGRHAVIAWMKIDAQGFDTLVLRGAARLLTAKRIEHFRFEFSPFLMPGRKQEAVDALRWLASFGTIACAPCNQKNSIPRVNSTIQRVMHPVTYDAFVKPFVGQSYDDIACARRDMLMHGNATAPADHAPEHRKKGSEP